VNVGTPAVVAGGNLIKIWRTATHCAARETRVTGSLTIRVKICDENPNFDPVGVTVEEQKAAERQEEERDDREY